MERNLTQGNVLKNLISFALPFLLSYFLQTLYGLADLFVIGQFCETDATTAVSIGSQVMHMITVMVVGLAMGTTVLIGRAVGANNRTEVSGVVGNTITLFGGIALVLTGILLLLTKPIVTLLSTPEEAVEGTRVYLTVCFAGIPFIVAYNVISAIYRGMGDSRRPMYFVAIACACNVVTDFVLIGVCGMGAAGAALGTTLSQTVSVLIALGAIRRSRKGIRVNRADWIPKKDMMKSLLKIGVPVSLQDGFIQVAFMVITVFANMRGLQDAAAVGIVEKIIGIFFLIPSTMMSTISALSAQNMGAGRDDRAKQTLFYGCLICGGFGILVSAASMFLAEGLTGLFTDDMAVIRGGGQYLRGYVWDCIFAGVHFCFSGFFCAYGYSLISFLHNCASILLMRIPIAYFGSTYFENTLLPMGIASPAGSALSVGICVAAYYVIMRKKREVEDGYYNNFTGSGRNTAYHG